MTIVYMRIQVRVDDDLAETLEEEAEEMGYDTLSSYVRWIIKNRDGSLQDRVGELEDRLTAVEQRFD